ncbi:zinc finger protein 271-like isoform X1 [Saccostrea cucullata]|uniref:zinc finger protein 271-like isoform X1 n=1 Tax=Saccostrea cuccullata TaxID=36930 RepID=UPI002ED4F999
MKSRIYIQNAKTSNISHTGCAVEQESIMEDKSTRRYPCLQCHRTYSRKHDMERHVDICHTATAEKPFRCEQCKFVFSTEEKLRVHESGHSQEMKFSCQVCGKGFKNSNAWKRHMKAHLDPKPFVCRICKREFGREHDMYRHTVRMHTGERKFQCDLCPSKFAWFSDLTIHKRRHNAMGKIWKGRKFGANGDAPKKVKKKVQLKKKVQKAEHGSRLVCKMCSQSFTSFSSLQLHACDLDSSGEEDEEMTNEMLSSKNNHTPEGYTKSFSFLKDKKSDNKSSSEIQENEGSKRDTDSDEMDLYKESEEEHFDDFSFENDDDDESMGDLDSDSENIDYVEKRNTLSPISDSKKRCSPESNDAQNEEIDNVRSSSQNSGSLVKEKAVAVDNVVPSPNTMNFKNQGKQSNPLTDIENMNTCSKSGIDTKHDEDLNLNSHMAKTPESLVPVNKTTSSSICVTPSSEVDVCHGYDVAENGKTAVDTNSKAQVITNSNSKWEERSETNDEHLKCKICQKEFNKFSALQLHMCEEPLNQEEILQIPKHNKAMAGKTQSHSKDVKQNRRISQNSSNIERMVTRSKGFNSQSSQNSSSLKTAMVTRSKDSVKKKTENSAEKVKSSSESSTKEKNKAAKTSTKQSSYRCEECSGTFSKLHEFKKHSLAVHRKKVTFTCSVCKKVFDKKGKLDIHLYSHEAVQPHQCQDCGHRFKHKRDLLKHESTHTNKEVPVFKCSFCRKEYSRQYDLRRHLECVHPAVAPYRCEICHAAFSSSEDCSKHLKTHETTHPYTCDVCQRGLSTIPILRRHMRMHLKEKPYSCPECRKGFNRRHDLYQHTKIHSTERFTCDLCYRKFVTPLYLRKHIKNKHGLSNNIC